MKQLSLSWLLFTSILIIIVITVSIMGGMWIYDTQLHSQMRSDDMVESLMSSYKATLRQTVMSEVEHITYKKTHTEEILKKSIKDRTYEAYDIASNIYETYKDSKSEAYIKDIIVETLRHITFNNGRGYYFIDNLQGDVILYPVHPELEGDNIWKLKDQNGHYVIQEEIDLIETSKEGFIEGYWEKPDSVDINEYKKITFIKSFEPYDWYIGCGEYVEDVKDDVQNEVLSYFNQLRFGNDSESYIFIHDLNGIELANGRYPEMVGENNYNLKNFEGTYIVREQINLVQDEQEGFLVHGWVDKGESFHKLTYVYLIPEWNWIVGSSLNLTEIQDLIDLEQSKLDLRKKDQLFKIAGLYNEIELV